MPGSRVSSCTCRVWSGRSSGTRVCLHRPWWRDDWERIEPRGPAGFGLGSVAVEHRVRRGASGADASELGTGVLRRRHVGAGLRQGDAGAHQARMLWRILAPNQEGSDRPLPPLRCERGFGAAHVTVLSGVGAAAPRSHHGNRVGSLATGDSRGTVGEREREKGRDLLL